MSEFLPGEEKIAVVPMSNPTAGTFDYSAELYMGTNLALMASKDFHLEAGESKDISLPIIMPSAVGTYPVHIGVFSAGENIGLYKAVEDVVIIQPALVLSFTNPRFKSGYWDLSWRNIGVPLGWKGGTPGGAKAQDIPCSFSPELEFLLRIDEDDMRTGACWLGPYLVEIPELGEYIWNSREGEINGIKALELPTTDNECIISGILESVSWTASGWGATILVDAAEDVSGKVNVGQYFIGDRISSRSQAILPRDGESGSLVIQTGRRITCRAKLGYISWAADGLIIGHIDDWQFSDFHYYPEYPPEYYEFVATLSQTGQTRQVPAVDYYYTEYEVAYSITGNAPRFSVLIGLPNIMAYGWLAKKWELEGPASGTIWSAFGSMAAPCLVMYAHPSLTPPTWDRFTWRLNNWQEVARVCR